MQNTVTKRIFSFLLALMIVFSASPAQAIAAEVDSGSQEAVSPAADANTLTEASAETVAAVQALIDDLLTDYFGTTTPTETAMDDVVNTMDESSCQSALDRIHEIEASEAMQQLSEAQVEQLCEDNHALLYFLNALEQMTAGEAGIMPITDVTVTDIVTVSDTQGNATVSGNTVTAQASGGLWSQKTNTISLKSALPAGSSGTLIVSYSASNYSKVNPDASGTVEYTWTPDTSIDSAFSITGKAAYRNNTATLTLTFTFVPASTQNITFDFDSSLGYVNIGGETDVMTPGTYSVAGTKDLTAYPADGAEFVGWLAADGSILTTSATMTYSPKEDTTITAVFAQTTTDGIFLTNSRQFNDLTAAAIVAKNGTDKTIIVRKDGTVTGSHTIPAGVTLLVPYDSSNTLCTTAPSWNATGGLDIAGALMGATLGSYAKPTAYRTLTLAADAHIDVAGAISLSGTMQAANGATPTTVSGATGPTSMINMSAGSSITLLSGANLYAYGFITGSGTVTARSGASVYEMFQFMGFRGGTQSTDSTMKSNKVFPISQYYVQNIESSLVLESGSVEYAYALVYASKSIKGVCVPFISSSGAMFNVSSGYARKQYDGSADRLTVELSGTASIASMLIDLSIMNIDSADYVLPLNSNITVHMSSGNATIDQDLAMLPGSKLIVDNGATINTGTSNIYIYDQDNWGKYCFGSDADVELLPIPYAPSKTKTRTTADLTDAMVVIDGFVDVSGGSIYTTSGGANITSTEKGQIKVKNVADGTTFQLIQHASTYDSITVTSAKLKNADGKSPTYTQTANSNGTVTYTYTDGIWLCDVHTPGAAATCTTDETCNVCGTVTTSALGHIDTNPANLRCDRCHEPMDAAVAQDNNEYSDDGYLKLYATLDDVPAGSTVTLIKTVIGYTVSKPMTICDPNNKGFDYENSAQYRVNVDANDSTIYHVVSNVVYSGITVTLKYEDVISVVGIFNFANVNNTINLENAYMNAWYGDSVTSGEPDAVYKLTMPTSGDYAGKLVGYAPIANRDLKDQVTVRAYVQLEDGTYVDSGLISYSVTEYAEKMLEEGSTASNETKTLAENLLNLVAATKWYFYNEEPTEEAKNVFADFAMDETGLAPEAPDADKQVDRDTEVFTYRAKNLLFQENINVASLYRIANFTDKTVGGTIFWTEKAFEAMTADQFKEVQETPANAKNYGATIAQFHENEDDPGFFLSAAPAVAAKDLKSSAKFYILAYVTDENGVHHFSGVEAYSVEQYIYNMANSSNAAMKYLARALYVYERSVGPAVGQQ